ncbi:Uma2 family endonuclease [Embleya sp. NPDC008237]|uniref:Uma2 family endonuclease n=1 Tax=unclassified Embleya TaxID=2699296 RepID=UPI0036E4B856
MDELTAPVIEVTTAWRDIVTMWKELEAPEGWRAEFDGENITMSPPPGHRHELIADDLHWQLRRAAPEGCGVFQHLGVEIMSVGRLCIPDLVVVAREDVATPTPADRVLLVAEITSPSNADTDRVDKLRAYAHGPIPLYLLVDRWDKDGPAATLYSEPDGKVYQRIQRVDFGGSVAVPGPFGIELDTSDFPSR